MNYFLFLLILTQTPVFSLEIVKKSKVFVMEGTIWSKNLRSIDIEYRYDSKQIGVDLQQPYFIVHYNKWVDNYIYLKEDDVRELLEAFRLFRLERENLFTKNEFISYFLGFINVAYFEESVAGLGAQIVDNPQINYSVYAENDQFYLKLAPIKQRSLKKKQVLLESIYLSIDQLRVLDNF